MRIAIYTHSGPEIGMGHAVRCSHLARALIAAGAEVDILSSLMEPGWSILSEIDGSTPWAIPSRNVVVADIQHMVPDVIVLDLMIADAKLMAELSAWPLAVVVGAGWSITEEVKKMASLLIYQTGFPIDGERISGPDYLILAPVYAALRGFERLHDILIAFGGGISLDYGLDVAQECSRAGLRGEIVVGSTYESDDKLPYTKNISAIWRPSSLYRHQVAARIQIGSMGMSTYEALATGTVPVLIGRTADHVAAADRLEADGLVLSMGCLEDVGPRDMAVTAAVLLDDRASSLAEMSVRGELAVDGKGAARVAKEILEIGHA